RKCGPEGEPEVVHVDQESDYRITFLAKSFEAFVRGLVNESVYDRSAENLKDDLRRIESGSFSTLLTRLLSSIDEPDFGPILRNICRTLTVEKGYFALHADELSRLVYDTEFYLFTRSDGPCDKDAFLGIYRSLIALGDGEFTTGGYGPDFVESWLADRLSQGE